MSCDKDLSGTDLKVVEYSIVSVDPDIEDDDRRLLYGPALITTTEDMTEADFAAWVIALYIQRPRPEILHRMVEHEEKQYLRVCFYVQCRMTIPDVNYEKQQAKQLRNINLTLKEMNRSKNQGGGQGGQGGQGSQGGPRGTGGPGGGQGGQGGGQGQGGQGNQGGLSGSSWIGNQGPGGNPQGGSNS